MIPSLPKRGLPKVCDRWWPYRVGRVSKRSAASIWVLWQDGEQQRYDKAHQQFLQVVR